MIHRAMETVAKITEDELAIPKEVAQSFAWNDIADYALEHQQYKLALTILKQIESIGGKVNLLVSISNTYIKNGDAIKARETLQLAMEMLPEVEDNMSLSYSMAITISYTQIEDYYMGGQLKQ